jgi:hypothetical protein
VVLALAETNTHFIIGLAYTEVAAAFINPEEGTGFLAFGIIMLLSVFGLFLFIGKKAHQPHKALYLAGIILYAIDGFIYLAVQDYLPALFHAYATWCLWTGYNRIQSYRSLHGRFQRGTCCGSGDNSGAGGRRSASTACRTTGNYDC